ncbi:MAG TPA: EamA family transporter [Mycobacteriales bacterium]|nr:EamA family transporter [Mycobacteriales bacterium]
MGVLLGIFCALSYGTGDYLGGRATRTAAAVRVVLLMQLTGATGMGAVVAVYHPHAPTTGDIVRGAVAGTAGCLGLGLLYWLLAHHRASVVAPITAVVATLMPIAWGIGHGERPDALGIIGIVLAIGAITLVSGAGRGPLEGVGLAVLTGVLFGSTLVLFSATTPSSGLWPVFAARSAAVVAVLVVMMARRDVGFPDASVRSLTAGAGVLDTAGNVFVQIAVRHGLLTVVSPIVALAPAVTVLFARALDHEHVGVERTVGLALSVASVAILAFA